MLPRGCYFDFFSVGIKMLFPLKTSAISGMTGLTADRNGDLGNLLDGDVFSLHRAEYVIEDRKSRSEPQDPVRESAPHGAVLPVLPGQEPGVSPFSPPWGGVGHPDLVVLAVPSGTRNRLACNLLFHRFDQMVSSHSPLPFLWTTPVFFPSTMDGTTKKRNISSFLVCKKAQRTKILFSSIFHCAHCRQASENS